MIKYNLNTINDWNFGDDNIIKVYRNNAVCYYKITGGGDVPTAQTPCFAVVDDISQYQDTEFEDVFNKADNVWYKLNNLNQYEEYGIYGSGRTSCEGSTSRLPQGYTEVEYVENTSTAYIDTGAYLDTSNFEIGYDIVGNSFYWGFTHQGYGGGTWITVETNTAFFGNYDNRRVTISPSSEGNTIKYESQRGITVNGTYTPKTFSIGSDSIANTPLYIFGRYDFRSRAIDTGAVSKLKSFYLKNNGTLVRDFVPAKRNSDDKYGMYDLVTGTFYLSPNNVDFIGGEPIAPTDCVTTYKGKLTVDDGYEYMYSGGSWINVGEVSGSSITIKSPEYIEKDSSHNGKINLDYVWKTNSKMQFKFYSTNNGGGAMIGEDGVPDNNDCRMFFASTTAYFDWGSSRISWSSNGRTNTLYEYEYGNYYIKNMVTSASKTGSTISTSRTNTLYFGLGGTDRFRTYYLKFYDGDTLVKDFIPWTDMNGNYGLFDKVSLSVYNVASGTLTGSSNVTDVEVGGGYEYPLEYVVREDPPNNLTFSSMTEAEEYECPWVGMKATIDGDNYVFSGDSISGYEWVYKPSRLPQGYTEVEYIENPSMACINTEFKPNQDTRIIAEMQTVASTSYVNHFGAGGWNEPNALILDYENNYNGTLHLTWGTATGWTVVSSVRGDYSKHTYDWNKNEVYRDNTLVKAFTYGNYQAVSNLYIFCTINNGSSTPSSSQVYYMKGKLYSFKIYDDGTLVRDFVPCINPNNVVGLYDVVNSTFYGSAYSGYNFIAGNPINS